MKQYKLLACDVDGTLLNDKGQISQDTISAIKQIIDKNIIFVISSGRGGVGLEFITKLFPEDIPCITFNGALVINSKNKTKIFEQSLEFNDAIKVIEFAINNNITFVTWQNENLYTNEINEKVLDYAKISKVKPIEVDDFYSLAREGLHKVLYYDDIKKINYYKSVLKIEDFFSVDYYTSQPFFLEFVNSRASKAIGLEKLGLVYNIDNSEMIAIGDGFNDLSMIQYAGLGVAMENAPKEIKEEADYITFSNNNEGVKHVIEKFILKQ